MCELYSKFTNSIKSSIIDENNYIFTVYNTNIQLDDNSWVILKPWQKKMIDELVNFAFHNQNKSIYYDTSLYNDIYNNGFYYNMIATMDGKIYLINLNTFKIREIKYDIVEKNIN